MITNRSKKIFLIITAVLFISWITPYAVLAVTTIDSGCGMSACMCADMKKCCCETNEETNEIKQARCDCTLSQTDVPETQTFLFSKTFKKNPALSLITRISNTGVSTDKTDSLALKFYTPTQYIPLYILKESFLV